MKMDTSGSIILLLLSVFTGSSFAAHTITTWPENKEGAISLLFDDACPSHVSLGIPALDAQGFKGTFFLVTNDIGGSWAPGWDSWKNAADKGHEIASHTMSHPHLTMVSLSQVQNEMAGAKAAIDARISSKKCLTFAYPYGDLNGSVESIAQSYFIASRGTSCDLNGEPYDFLNVKACSPDDGDDIYAQADAAEQQRKWLVVYIHTLNGGRDGCLGSYEMDQLTTYLGYMKGKNLWVGTFSAVSKYIKERASATLSVVSIASDQIVLDLTDTMDDAIYDQPLTIRSDVPPSWRTVTVQQGSSKTDVISFVEGATQAIYYNAVPDRGLITLRDPLGGSPQITSLGPQFVTTGSLAFTVSMSGSNFVNGSKVLWNGSARGTTFVSATQLRANILAADIATPGTIPVTVINPDGRLSNAMTFEIRSPPPTVMELSPAWGTSGGPSFTLIVYGSNFISDSKVRWKGSDRATGFNHSGEVQAPISATDIATAGVASVTVYNPSSGGGTSNAINFDIFPVDTALTVNPSRVAGGNSSTGTVTPSGPAPSDGAPVTLSSNNTTVAPVPSAVSVPEGATSATFPITTRAVTASTSVIVPPGSLTTGLILSSAGVMTVVNNRYFVDASGTPKFMIGYQNQMIGSTQSDVCFTLNDEINAMATYGGNYIRPTVAMWRAAATTDPPSCDGSTSRTPFLYVGGKADLNQWDNTFWINLRTDIEHAASHGIFMHLTVFNGYGLGSWEGAMAFEWAGADWNVANQTQSFYGNIDTNSDGDALDTNEFYNTTAFNAGTGVGYYQKRLIDKLISEVDGYNNVFYEVGNETGLTTGPAWTAAVRDYMITKTSKPVTINTCTSGGPACTLPSSTGGWVDHRSNSVAEVKSYVAGMVGRGYPAMVDPNGGLMMNATADQFRQAVWYALTGGAFGWGGFTSDFWQSPYNAAPNTTKLTQMRYTSQFLDNNAVRFWEMTPQQSLISTNTTNSLLANIGSQYLGYVLSGTSVNITLGTGTYSVKYFNPATGVTTSGTTTTGPATRTFNRPSGASDWAVFVYMETSPVYVTTVSLDNGTVSIQYSATLVATGGVSSPYTWSIISGALPTGLNLSSAGVISGTPTTAQTASFTVEARDNSGNAGTKALTITVSPVLSSVTVSPSTVVGGNPSTGTVTLSGSAPVGGVVVTLSSSNSSVASVPGSVTVAAGAASATFPIATSAVTASSTSVTVSASYAGAARTTTLTVSPGTGGSADISAPYATDWSPQKNATGVPITNREIHFHVRDNVDVLTANGSVTIEGSSYTCGSGITCAGNGTSDLAVTYTKGSDWANDQVVHISTSGFRDTASNIMTTDTWSYTIEPAVATLNITTVFLPGGGVDLAYSQTIHATGGATPYIFSVLSGSLPAGLTLSPAGVISGTPTGTGTSNFTLNVMDNVSATDNQALSITVSVSGNMTVVNNRYFADASGTPKFMIGYQNLMVGSTQSDVCFTLNDEINAMAAYGVNYIRPTVGMWRATSTTTPPSCDGSTSRTPFLYVGGKADLNQWDNTFWINLRTDIEHAASHGIFMHLTVFNGYGLGSWEGAMAFEWAGADWNVANQTQSFYGNIDTNSDGDALDTNEFYNTTAFNAGTGVGYYQKRLIDKLISEVDGYSNVFYEVGNETGQGTGETWTLAVRNYMITKTSKPVTINTTVYGQPPSYPSGVGGWISHLPNTVAETKSAVADMVGRGYPAMVDPDGGLMMEGTADQVRQAAWYSLTGGAFGWGGFTVDYWKAPYNAGPNYTKLTYYGYLLSFLDNNAVRFWEMTPQQSLISTNTTNSLLANIGSQYLGYVLSGTSVNITLGTGTYSVKYFNPATGVTTSGTTTTGPATRTFNRPSGASDWAVFVYMETSPVYVTTVSLDNGTVSIQYSATLVATGGVSSPYTWSIISGALPTGLNLSSAGVISGTPTTAQTASFTVEARDNSGNAGTKALTITVSPVLSSVTVSPSTVVGGNPSTGTVTLSGSAPVGGVVVTLSSSNSSVASVPGSVTVAAGAASATFPIATSAVTASSTSVTVSASYAGAARTTTLTVSPETVSPVLSSVTVSPSTVVGGNPSTGTVTLSGSAPVGGVVITLSSSNSSVASVPGSVTVAAGAASATFPIATSAVTASSTSVTVSASYAGAARTTTLTVSPETVSPVLSSVTVSPSTVVGGNPSTGTVTLSGSAPVGGVVITLSSSNSSVASVPGSVTVAAGAASATFPIATSAVTASSTSVTVSASYAGAARTTTLTVSPETVSPVLSSVTVSPSTVVGGNPSTGTVTLSGSAPVGGVVVTLSSSNSSVASVPGSVTVAAGAASATFPIATSAVTASSTSVTVSASYGGVTRTTTLTVRRWLSSVTVSPSTVVGGNPSTGTVSLYGPAPVGGVVVTLSSSNSSVASVPGSVTVPAGAASATFPIATRAVTASSTSVTVSASYGGVTRTTTLTVRRWLSSVTVSPSTVVGGNPSTGTVSLYGPAPVGGVVVTLSSSNSSVASVPGSVTVAAGAATATFPVATRAVTASTSVTVSASYGGVTRSANLSVRH